MKPFRQGQTLYYIDYRWMHDWKPQVVSVFLHSHKTPLPPEHCVIEKLPVTRANRAAAEGFVFFRSRRKARQALLRVESTLLP